MSLKNQLTTADHLSFEDYKRLLKGLHRDKKYMFEMFATLAFCTALRASDVLALKWVDILNRDRFVAVEKKTGKAREIPLSINVQRRIQDLYEIFGCPVPDSKIFYNSKTGKVITIQYINQHLKYFKYMYGLKIDHFSTHTFRKTFGRYVYDSNNHSAESLLLLNVILNHTSIDVTKRYIGLTKQEVFRVFQSIGF